ncbi:hypothetical protein Tco_1085581 [Tanacetum coccineum]
MSFEVATLRAVRHVVIRLAEMLGLGVLLAKVNEEYWETKDEYMWEFIERTTIRQAQLVDTESEPEEAPSEIEELQSLGSRVPLMGKEFKTVEPSGTRTDSSHSSSSSDSTTPLSPDHPLTYVSPTPPPTRASFHRRTTRMTVHVQPAMSLGYSARVTEVMALSDSAFRKRPHDEEVRSDLAHGHRVTLDLLHERFGLGLWVLRHRELTVEEDQVPSTFVVGQSSRSVSERQGAERVSVFRQPTLVTWIDPEDDRDHTQHLDVLTPTLIADIDIDVRDLYTRSGVVRDEIFSCRVGRYAASASGDERSCYCFREGERS